MGREFEEEKNEGKGGATDTLKKNKNNRGRGQKTRVNSVDQKKEKPPLFFIAFFSLRRTAIKEKENFWISVVSLVHTQ